MKRWVFVFGGLLALPLGAADVPYVNWENHPVRALDLSPDRRLVAVAHTADQRVQLFDVSADVPAAVGHVVVGVDPVAVKFRNDGELWVVNHISDSISVIDVARRSVRATLQTADEPFDIVFAGNDAFVSCSQANRVLVFDTRDLSLAPRVVPIAAEDPRALAVSADGRTVYAAIFESGNASTVLAGGLTMMSAALPNVVSDARGPYAGRNPPPNAGANFEPAVHPAAPPPAVGLIVKKGRDGRWRDDNIGDWSAFVGGDLAAASGRLVGWDLPDRDLAIIDAATLSVRYASGLMNANMALAVDPVGGRVTVVGTDGINEVRFEPRLNGRFHRVNLARVDPASGAASITDLNPHLDYREPRIAPSSRAQSIGDPRALVWRADGQRAWIAGLGSNNVVAIDASGRRVGSPIAVGQGPIGLALDEPRSRLFVWNHFDATLSQIDLQAAREVARVAAFNPLPVAIRAGRPFLYDTQRTSGTGQAACASCHIDARMDRLAWDLGDPSHAPQTFDQNCVTMLGSPRCANWHAMKGPMTTQTMQDIIGHEPHHWRGDRAGIEAFNPTYTGLLGDDVSLTLMEMQLFEDYLATITFPPNPFRNLDNSLPAALSLDGQFTSARFGPAGRPLGIGNAVRGLQLYTGGLLDSPFQCSSCHTLPTGMAVNGPLLLGAVAFPVGGSVMPRGPNGENHLGIVSVDGSTNVSIKVPHLRNAYEKVGFESSRTDGNAGFGFLHDGSVDSIASFFSARAFSVRSDQEVADLVALMMAFSGSEFGDIGLAPGAPAPLSLDTHAAVGAQETFVGIAPARALQLLALARVGKVDLIARSGTRGFTFDRSADRFLTDDGTPALTLGAIQSLASTTQPMTVTAVPPGLGARLGIDRDADGIGNAQEIVQGSNPADAASRGIQGTAGLWFNPARSGHGLDLEYAAGSIAVVWYTYEDDGTPTWYSAAAPRANPWRAELARVTRNPSTGSVTTTAAGEVTLSFQSAVQGEFRWRLGSRSGSEPIVAVALGGQPANPDRTGIWFDPTDSGWGLSVFSDGALRTALVYFYDAQGEPRWVLGQGSNVPVESLVMRSFRGFCPDCARVEPVVADAGVLRMAFEGGRKLTADVDIHLGQPGVSAWRRSAVRAVPITDLPLRPAAF